MIFNDAVKYEFPHMYFAALVAAGFLVASPYAVRMLRGRRDRYHRKGFLLPFTIAAIAIPIQMGIGDSTARAIYSDQPMKFAALELNTTTGSDKPEIILGHLNEDGTVSGGLKIPGLASFLSDPPPARARWCRASTRSRPRIARRCARSTRSTWPGT